MKIIERIGEMTGNYISEFFASVGKFIIFVSKSLGGIFSGRWYFNNLLDQFLYTGVSSIPVVVMTAVFTGGVMALQTYAGCNRFGAESTVPTIVVLAMTRELAPILVGLMVAGRVSSSMAAQIGTMRVTDQIDALYTMSTCPYKYLILPKIIAMTLSMPFLVLIADVIGIFGGTLASVTSLGFDLSMYLHNTMNFLKQEDIYSGLVKSVVFGFIVSICGCYNGFYSDGGADGVGKATTNAVISASISILISNYLMTKLFFV
ncbi:MAG: ABC transporter permease [Rickettsiales bacterium]|jgi:phospholipid/cholesterol/gamma-HCH transport system permease protein|nr:ABC transporter permease [Rickettsiales bacterium]